KARPVPSLLRRFSAPVILNYPYSEAELLQLLAHDDDPFNRWEAGQRVAASIILEHKGEPSRAFIEAMAAVLAEPDRVFAAEVLMLPAESFLAEQMEVVDPDALHEARNTLRRRLAAALRKELVATYERLASSGAYSPDAASIGRRALRNQCLGYLTEFGEADLAYQRFRRADNMTDAMAALTALAQLDCPEREKALAEFYARWKDEPLVVDKWLAVQAGSRQTDTLARVWQLLGHPAFDLKVP